MLLLATATTSAVALTPEVHTVPVSGIEMRRDYCFPASMAWDIYAAIPKAYLWVVPKGGHVPISGPRAGAFAETALEFLGGDWEVTE